MPDFKAEFRDKGLFGRLFGRNVYAVGGFVRDLIMGTPSDEVDILVTGFPLEEIIRRISPHGKVDLVGRSFGVIKFTVRKKTYDLALPRTDTPAEPPARRHRDFLIPADPHPP